MPAPKRVYDARGDARTLLRQWLVHGEDTVLAAVDALGRQAIREAAQASGRMDRLPAHTAAAQDVLGQLQALAADFAAPPPAPKWKWFGSREAAPRATTASLDTLVASLARERDAVARTLIAIETDKMRLAAGEQGLDDALELIRACASACESAARELAPSQPARAAFLRDAVAARLLERERDLLNQVAVTRQGILALQLVAEGQEALAKAIDRARDTSVAALRTAIAARHAVNGSQDLAAQAQALERTAAAARDAPTSRGDVQRALDDAMAQVRRAVDAAERGRPDPHATP